MIERAVSYKARIDGGDGGTETFTANTAAEALVQAIEWAKKGDWPEEGCGVDVRVENSTTGIIQGTKMRLTGNQAIDYAEANDLLLSKYNDPIEEARENLSVDDARKVAREDPSLIWIEVDEQDADDL